MKRRIMTLALAALAALSAGCALLSREAAEEQGPETYDLYFQVRDLEAAGGADAIAPVPCGIQLQDDREAEALAAELVALLLQGPTDEAYKSPFPTGTSLRNVRVEDGRAVVDLSSAYRALSGVGLTMADYCVALTLTQIPRVETVSVTVGGRELAYRGEQDFSGRDVLFSSKEDVVGTVDVTLYFLNDRGVLTGENRTLDLYEGDTQAETLARALLAGPESRELSSALPEGFGLQAVWMEEDVCCVNLTSSMLDGLSPDAVIDPAVRALSRSLLTLEPVEAVRFLRDGQTVDRIRDAQVDRLFEE